jgi:hypothetical protein
MAAEGFGDLAGGKLPRGEYYVWWEDKDPVAVAKLLHYYEQSYEG